MQLRLQEVEGELRAKRHKELEQMQQIQGIVSDYGAKIAKLEWELSVARGQPGKNAAAALTNLQQSPQSLPSSSIDFVLPPVTPVFARGYDLPGPNPKSVHERRLVRYEQSALNRPCLQP